MPTRRISVRRSKRSRARHLQKHSPELSLDVDAKPGTYRIDNIAAELYEQGVFLNSEPFESFLKKLRRSVDFAGCFSLMYAQAELVRAPDQIRLTKRFFEDVKAISHLIQRNKNADPHYITLYVKHLRRRNGWCSDRTSSLLTKLRDAQAEIEEYVSDYAPIKGNGGNRDSHSYNFICEMLNIWRDYGKAPPEQAAAERAYIESVTDVPKMFRSEYRRFARFLDAGWRDLGFPLVDHRNASREPLEDWFADRVRKQFVDTSLSVDKFLNSDS